MRTKPNSCAGCACHPHGTDFSAVDGSCQLGVMLVGEASGREEARDQLPFRPYAPAGSVLERAIRRMGYSRGQFAVTNVLRCRPRNDWLEKSPWERSAIGQCRPNLDAALRDYRPRAIWTCGNIPLRELTQFSGVASEKQSVSHLTGYVLPGPGGIPVVPGFHTAYLRRGKISHFEQLCRTLRRSINVAGGKDQQYFWEDYEKRLRYATHPSIDEFASYVGRVTSNSGLTVCYDLETSESASLDEDAREGFVDTRIRLAQFSVTTGEAIAVPWEGGYRDLAARLLQTPNVKVGHNLWLFDNKVLRAVGEREGLDLTPRGPVHDTLQMFHHWQPDLPAHLQFAAQFVQFPFPWKHLAGSDLPFYGCCDVDATLRLYQMLESALRREGIYDGPLGQGYVGQVLEVRPVLAGMEDRGLPIDDRERLRLDDEFRAAGEELASMLDGRFPDEARSIHPKEGYKKTPKDTAGLVVRTFNIPTVDDATGMPVNQCVERWCRPEAFSPNSAPQLLRYMKAKHHPVPKSKETDDLEGQKDTTAKKELQRLAKRTGDDFYLKVIEYRELSKMRGTYIDGFAPQADGCVHTTFTFDTGTGQLTSRNPNVQNFPKHGRLAKPLRRMIAAPQGWLLAEADYRAFHVLTTGYCAEDPDYMRMARLDMHSYVAGHFLGCWDAGRIKEESNEALLERFNWFKQDADRKRVRDKQAKPSILGIGFGMGYRRLYQENLEHFPRERTAKQFHDLLRHLFPRVFAWQDRIRRLAHEQSYLRSPFGHVRRFYEVFRWDSRKADWAPGDQAEEAVAFLPANLAFGMIRETFKDLEQRGLAGRYGLINNVHDSFLFLFPQSRLEAFAAEVLPVLTAPSRVLIHPLLAPHGLSVDVEVNYGPNWSEMEALNVSQFLPA